MISKLCECGCGCGNPAPIAEETSSWNWKGGRSANVPGLCGRKI